MTTSGPFGFSNGWNSKASAITMPSDSLADAQDINISYGDISKRLGSLAINSAAISGTPIVHGLADWQTPAGQRYLVVTAGSKIFQTADLGSSLTDITGSATITAGANNQDTFCALNGKLLICGGTTPDAPLQWTGTGNVATLAGSPPTGNICVTANNFAFISGIAATPSRVFWCNVIDPGTWPVGNYVDFKADDGDKVTVLCEFNQNLIIFKRTKIGQLWTVPPSSAASVQLGPLTQIIPNVGCPGSQCLDKTDDGRIAFLGTNNHVYLFDGTNLQDISDQPSPKSSIQPTLDALNLGRISNAVLRFYGVRRELWLSVSESSQTSNNAVYVYSLVSNCWESRFSNIAANVMCSVIDTRTTPSHPITLVTGNYGGLVFEQDKGTTNAEVSGGAIDGYGTVIIQNGLDSKSFQAKSLVLPIQSNGNTNLEVNYGFNGYTETPNNVMVPQQGGGNGLDSFVLDTDVLSGNSTLYRTVNITSPGSEFTSTFQFRNRNASESFTVHPFYISDEVVT